LDNQLVFGSPSLDHVGTLTYNASFVDPNGNGCESPTTAITLTFYEAPTPANAGADVEHCNSGSYTMAANAASVGQGTWTVVNGNASAVSIADVHSPTTAVTVAVDNVVTLRWTIVNGDCVTSDDVIISNFILPVATISSSTDVNCNGGSNGTATVVATVGASPYTYLWNNGQTTATATGLVAATYSVTATDIHGCTGSTSVIINQPAPVVLTKTQTNVLCNGASTGAIDLTVNGGTTTLRLHME